MRGAAANRNRGGGSGDADRVGLHGAGFQRLLSGEDGFRLERLGGSIELFVSLVVTGARAFGVVTLVVKPTVWLDQIDFEAVAASEDGAPVDLEPESQAQRGFTRGLKKGTAYALSFAPGSPEEKE